jgi:hypothetical protein
MKKYIIVMKSGARITVESKDKPRIVFNDIARESHLVFGYSEFPFFAMCDISGCTEHESNTEEVINKEGEGVVE